MGSRKTAVARTKVLLIIVDFLQFREQKNESNNLRFIR
jgi:hypothetical protein